jgi:hypothetical protein
MSIKRLHLPHHLQQDAVGIAIELNLTPACEAILQVGLGVGSA